MRKNVLFLCGEVWRVNKICIKMKIESTFFLLGMNWPEEYFFLCVNVWWLDNILGDFLVKEKGFFVGIWGIKFSKLLN